MSRSVRQSRTNDASTREMILRAASALFAEMGYTRTSLAQVADGLGITRQAFYYHFRNKDDILAALFNRAMALVEAEVEQRMVTAEQPRYLEMLSGHMKVVMDNVDLIKITTHERPTIDELDSLHAEERRAAYARKFVKAFQEGVTAKQLWAAHPSLVVQSNLGTINALCTWWKPGSGLAAAVVHAQMLDIFRRGLVVKD